MYDVKHQMEFLIGDNPEQYESFWWNDAEPVWIATVRQVCQIQPISFSAADAIA